jgi:hypothetical protein
MIIEPFLLQTGEAVGTGSDVGVAIVWATAVGIVTWVMEMLSTSFVRVRVSGGPWGVASKPETE